MNIGQIFTIYLTGKSTLCLLTTCVIKIQALVMVVLNLVVSLSGFYKTKRWREKRSHSMAVQGLGFANAWNCIAPCLPLRMDAKGKRTSEVQPHMGSCLIKWTL